MKPFLNLSAISDYVKIEHGNFKERYFGISEKLGAKKLGYSVVILEPGYK